MIFTDLYVIYLGNKKIIAVFIYIYTLRILYVTQYLSNIVKLFLFFLVPLASHYLSCRRVILFQWPHLQLFFSSSTLRCWTGPTKIGLPIFSISLTRLLTFTLLTYPKYCYPAVYYLRYPVDLSSMYYIYIYI